MDIKLKIDKDEYFKNTNILKKEPNSIVFYLQSWNDFGYKTCFTACYYDEKQEEHIIGEYRIFHAQSEVYSSDNTWEELLLDKETYDCLDKDDINIDSINLEDDKKYFSLARSQRFYTSLYRYVGQEQYDVILKKLRDLTTFDNLDGILEAETAEYIYSHVIFRNDMFVSEARKIIGLMKALKRLDRDLNVGNYVANSNVTKFLRDVDKTDFINNIESAPVDFLESLIDNYSESNQHSYDFIKQVIQKSGDYSNENYYQLLTRLDSKGNEQLSDIKKQVKRIKEQLIYSEIQDGDHFVHYTSLSTLDVLIRPKSEEKDRKPQLRLSNTRQMNDPTEGSKLFDVIFAGFTDNDNKLLFGEKDYVASTFYLSSMSKVDKQNNIHDSLPMWKMYGGNTAGISLTYDKDFISSIIESEDVEIYKVCYLDDIDKLGNDDIKTALSMIKRNFSEILKISDANEKSKLLNDGLSLLEPIRYLFKESSYQYESEYRILGEFTDSQDRIKIEKYGEMLIPRLYIYLESSGLKFSKVILGPNSEDIDFIAPYIKYCDKSIEVTKSKIAYR